MRSRKLLTKLPEIAPALLDISKLKRDDVVGRRTVIHHFMPVDGHASMELRHGRPVGHSYTEVLSDLQQMKHSSVGYFFVGSESEMLGSQWTDMARNLAALLRVSERAGEIQGRRQERLYGKASKHAISMAIYMSTLYDGHLGSFPYAWPRDRSAILKHIVEHKESYAILRTYTSHTVKRLIDAALPQSWRQ